MYECLRVLGYENLQKKISTMSDSPNCAPLPSYEKATNDTDIEQQAVVESASDKSDPAEINWSGVSSDFHLLLCIYFAEPSS